jgi:hypothetical protein
MGPRVRGNDKYESSFSRHGFARGFQFRSRLKKKEGAGKTGCALHPRSHVQCASKENAHEHTGSAETLRPSLRNGFTTYIVLSLVNRSFLPPSPPRGVSLSRT